MANLTINAFTDFLGACRIYNKYYMKSLFSLIVLIVLLASCSSITGDRPAGTLSESAMGDILTDMHLVESKMRVTTDSLSLIQLRDTTYLRVRFAEVFRKHETSPDKFNKSLDYYLKHIEILDEIYDEVIANLTELEAKATKKENSASTDSIVKSKKKLADTLINENNTAKVKKP